MAQVSSDDLIARGLVLGAFGAAALAAAAATWLGLPLYGVGLAAIGAGALTAGLALYLPPILARFRRPIRRPVRDTGRD